MELRFLDLGVPGDGSSPALSPDCRWLVFSRITGVGNSVLLLVAELDEQFQPKGAPRQLNAPRGLNVGGVFTNDGKEIVSLTARSTR